MRYEGSVYRPPSEARSLIIQATIGCTHNSCAFCPMFKEKKFRMRPFEEVFEDLKAARREYGYVRRVFYADGDAFCMSADKLLRLIEAARAIFPECERVSFYGRASEIAKKSDRELLRLKDAGLGIVYIGAESGSPMVLQRVNKGETPEEIAAAVARAESLGITTSVTFISGLGGRELMEEHAVRTGEMIGGMGASYVGLLTLMLAPGTPMFEDAVAGRFLPLSEQQVAQELKLILNHADCRKPCVIRSNHVSNRLVLHGTLPQDKEVMLAQVESYLGV